jgi:predicted acylesterase/phospholipase RssA/CRP-like cAMP-binding protein
MTGQQDLPGLAAFLAGIALFAALDDATRLELARELEPVDVPAGEVIFRQGDAGEGLYVVVSGRLRVSVAGDMAADATADGAGHVLYDLGRGAVVGEMALVTDRPRAATVCAVRDSDLLLLRVSSFRALLERSPALARGIIRLLVDRLLAVDRLLTSDRPRAALPGGRAIAVAPAGRNANPAATVAGQLAAELKGAVRVDSAAADKRLGPGAAQRGPGHPGRAELIGWLHATERAHDRVIYQSDAGDTAWSRLCLSQSDVVLLVAAATDDPSLGPVEARALATGSLRCELALLHAAEPAQTARWLERRPVADHHHLRKNTPGDVARLARMITGTGCGLVLGGGGARGLTHLGVIRALEEAGVPVDVAGGTSMGAIMAALCARGLDDAERVRRVRDIARHGRRLLTPTLPLLALSAGRYLDRILAEHLTAVPIEDLPRRFYCVSSNLTRAEEVVHERGPLWEAVRASLALPGIFPPVYAGGDLLIDGAAINNVPVDVMRGRVGGGTIVAVDVSPEVEPLTAAPFEPGLSGWRVLGRRLNPFAPPQLVPGIADILSRATGLSQVRNRRALDDGVDLVLRPPVTGFGVLDFKGGIALFETGYRYAAAALAESGLAARFRT